MVEKEMAAVREEITEITADDDIKTNRPQGFFKRHGEALVALLCSMCILAACIINLTAKEDTQKNDVTVLTGAEETGDKDGLNAENELQENTGENVEITVITDENGNRPFVRPAGIAPSPLNEEKIDPAFPSDISKALKVNMVTSDKKVAYLTFDDGPSDNTEQILEILKKYGVKATFFVLGEKCELRPELVKKMFDEGHTIGNHTYSHDYEAIYESAEALREEIYKTEDIIAGIIGRENVMKLFRFPGGAMSPRQSELRADFENFGYKYADWNALNGDAEMADYTYDHCISRIKETCSDTGDVVILMHDAPLKTMTVAALPETIEYLISQGYSFERIVP